MKYGAIVMRAQPFHIGHMSLVNKVIEDGLIPIIIIGSADKSHTPKNPYTSQQRINMIRSVYPPSGDVIVKTINDYSSNEQWMNALRNTLNAATRWNRNEVTMYLHEKVEDCYDFKYDGVQYINESYCKMYDVEGIPVKKLPISNICINATSIRADLEKNKEYLHPNVYRYIKALNVKESKDQVRETVRQASIHYGTIG